MWIMWPTNYIVHEEDGTVALILPKCPGLMADSFKEIVK